MYTLLLQSWSFPCSKKIWALQMTKHLLSTQLQPCASLCIHSGQNPVICFLITLSTEAPARNRGSRQSHMLGQNVWLTQNMTQTGKSAGYLGWHDQDASRVIYYYKLVFKDYRALGSRPVHKDNHTRLLHQVSIQLSTITSWHLLCNLLILDLLMSTESYNPLMCEFCMDVSISQIHSISGHLIKYKWFDDSR